MLGPGGTFLVPLPNPGMNLGGVRFRMTDGVPGWADPLVGE